VEAEAAIGLDRPRCFISAIGATEDEGAVTGLGQQRLVGSVVAVDLQRDHHQAFSLARFGRLVQRRVHGQVLTGVGFDVELQHLAHRRIALVPLRSLAGLLDHRQVFLGQHVGQGDRLFRAFAIVVHQQVDEENLVARLDAVFREVDDDVEALGDALGGRIALWFCLSPSASRSMVPSNGTLCSMMLPSLAIMWNGTRA
jgi:hypothetical protein